jgi:hypothetical protein
VPRVKEKKALEVLSKNPEGNLAGLMLDWEEAVEAVSLRRYVTNDSTPAALGELFLANPNGILVHRDEIVSLLQTLDRDENAEGRGFYLTGWGAGQLTQSTGSRAASICIFPLFASRFLGPRSQEKSSVISLTPCAAGPEMTGSFSGSG